MLQAHILRMHADGEAYLMVTMVPKLRHMLLYLSPWVIMNFNETDKAHIQQFLENVRGSSLNGVSSKEQLWELTDSQTRPLIEYILALDPTEYGFRGKQLPQEPVPTDVVEIRNPTENASGEYKLGPAVYLPEPVYKAFGAMALAFTNENPGRELLVGSGYRSPAFQTVTLVYILARVYDFDISQTLKRVALPDYSQHCSATHTAIDMLNIDGEPSDEAPQQFGNSFEYAWLRTHAGRFNFRESYPPDNPDGIMWEPWHWQFIA